MDEETSKLPSKENVSTESSDQTDSGMKTEDLFTEVFSVTSTFAEDLSLNGEAMTTEDEIKEDIKAQIETVSVLLKSSDKVKCDDLLEKNSISMPIRNSISLNDFSEKSLQSRACNDMPFPPAKCLKRSSSYNDITLPLSDFIKNSVSHTSSAIIPNYKENPNCTVVKNYTRNDTTCDVNKKPHFGTKLCNEVYEIVETSKSKSCKITNAVERVEKSAEFCNENGQLTNNHEQSQVTKSLMKYDANCNNNDNSCVVDKCIKSKNNIISKPTLVDDIKLVKISLPTNPIHIMQSNAQFLNRSRNFFNFITEKSTNIMERALLPQHLQARYNLVMKSIDSNESGKKHAEESSTTDVSLAEWQCHNKPVLTNNVSSTVSLMNRPVAVEREENEFSKNNESKTTLVTTSNIHKPTNIEKDNSNRLTLASVDTLDNTNDFANKLQNFKYSDLDNITNKLNCNDLSKERNGDVDIDRIIFNSESNDAHEDMINGTCINEEQNIILDESMNYLLQHPGYLTLFKNYADLKSAHLKLQGKIEHLEGRNKSLEAENKGGMSTTQIEMLEKTINRLTHELHTSLEAQEILKKEYNAANKERESMVMKYAVSEKQLIDTQRARENAERKVREITTQQESLQTKLREMQGERTRICNILSGKHRETTVLQREVEKLKEDVKMRDKKLQWNQSKLKTEMDTHEETRQKLDKALVRINEMKEECEQVRKETQETMRKFQQSEENKAVTLDQKLKEEQARLILERHVTEDKEMLRLQLQKEVDTLKHRQQVLIEENNTLSLKIQDAEKNRWNYESNLSNLKIIADQRQKEIVDLLGKVSDLETLKAQLQHKEQYLASTEAEIEHLRMANEELQSDMSACRQKEAEMLDFTQKLTDKNVRLQSEFTAVEGRAKELEQEHDPLHEQIRDLTKKIKSLETCIAKEQRTRIQECEALTKRLAEQTQIIQNLTQQLEDSQGENAVLKRKQQINMKEMTRELQQCRKKLEAFETSSPYNSLGVVSRSGSNVSLNTGDTPNGALSDNSINGDQIVLPMEPSRQTLIDRIIKLQESNARKAEKLDFFEEHTRILVEELQKKKRIIQTYILHENIGAMGSNDRDKYKAELAKHGGIMASVYNHRVSDDNMTLELSLEINQKLQAVLEDALFKNITLKDNIDTLGEEIARLTMQNQKR